MSSTVAEDIEYRQSRLQEELPRNREGIQKALDLIETYSRIGPQDIEAHVRSIRDQAFSIAPYACVGKWRFLRLYIAELPQYPSLVRRIKDGEMFLDVGCCFGQVLRLLASDGAPDENLGGVDLRQEFIDLGYELFRDKDRFKAKFAAGNLLEDGDALALDESADIIHAASLFHLFTWDDQVKLGARLIRFFKPSASVMLLGMQVGNPNPKPHVEHDELGLGRYHHNEATLQELWDEIGEKTGTAWKTRAAVRQISEDVIYSTGIVYQVTRAG